MSIGLEGFHLPKTQLPEVPKIATAAKAALGALAAAHRRDYPAGTVLKLAGEETRSVFLVLSGWVLTSKSLANGHRQIIDVVLPGGLLHPTAADLMTSALDVETLTDSTIALIPPHDWRRICATHPELAELNQKVTSAALARISERVLRLGKAPAETMIAFVLFELCLRSSAQCLYGKEFHIPMTQQQLGDLCGLSAVHICRTLRRLGRNGVLSVTDHMKVTIHDVDELTRIADIDIEALQKEIVAA